MYKIMKKVKYDKKICTLNFKEKGTMLKIFF